MGWKERNRHTLRGLGRLTKFKVSQRTERVIIFDQIGSIALDDVAKDRALWLGHMRQQALHIGKILRSPGLKFQQN